MIIGIDPGPELCAFVGIDDDAGLPLMFGIDEVSTILSHVETWTGDKAWQVEAIVCEDVACMGMRVGREVFDTCKVIGRLWQAVGDDFKMVERPVIKRHFTGHRGAKDADIRCVLIDRYGPGKPKAVGTKASPGPLYGIKKDEWQALAVARYWLEQLNQEKQPCTE